jgi:hypothetical protein
MWRQKMIKGFTELGFKTQVKPLSDFKESYGLEGGEEEGDEDENENGEGGSGSGSGSEED